MCHYPFKMTNKKEGAGEEDEGWVTYLPVLCFSYMKKLQLDEVKAIVIM